jgi:hypothetical protein
MVGIIIWSCDLKNEIVKKNKNIKMKVFEFAGNLLREKLTKAGVDSGHSLGHALIVMRHAEQALKCEDWLTEPIRDGVLFAAFLHDADDEKFFGRHSDNYPNAREIMERTNLEFPDLHLDIELVIQMISLVSASKNKNSKVDPGKEFMLLPRWCDRLEAIGQIGLDRAIGYAKHIGNPMVTPDTPSVANEDDLQRIAPYSRFLAYQGQSASVIDHIYDKILHIGLRPEDTTNEYLLRISSERTQIIKDFVFNYWRDNKKN